MTRAGFAAFGSALWLQLSSTAGCHAPAPVSSSTAGAVWAPVKVLPADFHGWPAMVMRGQSAEVVVVPGIGRVMQFRLLGPDANPAADTGPFWQNPRLARDMPGDENGWINYGGDKTWPAPQAEWPQVAGRGWPPPATFDARPFTAAIIDGALRLTSEVDPAYGIVVERDIRIHSQRPEMMIETRYRKVSGPPVRVAVWTITQLVSPRKMLMHLSEHSVFPAGYKLEMPAEPRDLSLQGSVLSLARDPVNKTMIGSDADALSWFGERLSLMLTRAPSKIPADAAWADDVRAQIYTSSDDALPYVELELLGPLRELRVGEDEHITVDYELARL